MAKNQVQEGRHLWLNVGVGVKSGDPIAVGQITGVATIDADAAGYATVDTGNVVYDLSVKAIDAGGNSAVAIGDAIYYVTADNPKLSKKNTGVLFGHALEIIAAGGTDTINVKLK